jgi:hypothetical protein
MGLREKEKEAGVILRVRALSVVTLVMFFATHFFLLFSFFLFFFFSFERNKLFGTGSVRDRDGTLGVAWVCDLCGSPITHTGSREAFHCPLCDFDVCLACVSNDLSPGSALEQFKRRCRLYACFCAAASSARVFECVYVCMYVCMYVWMYVCMYV